VVGDGRPCLGALVVIESTAVGDWAADRGASFTTFATLSALPEVAELIGDAIEASNANVGEAERVCCFAVVPYDICADEDLVTPTAKLRRGRIAQRFAEEIEQMYAGRGSSA
jgi:long-chain acyl-CoA synthetase